MTTIGIVILSVGISISWGKSSFGILDFPLLYGMLFLLIAMNKTLLIRCTAFILLLSGTCIFSGCQTTVGPLPGSRTVHVTEVFAGAGLFDLIVTSVSLADPDIGEDTIRKLLQEINQDPDLIIYWVPSSNPDITNLSYRTALLNGSIVFAKYSLKRSAEAMKRSARAGMAVKTVEEIGEDDTYVLTEEEEAALKARAAELSADERAELKKCFIYLSCASAALTKVPFTVTELLEQTALFIQEPERLISDPFELPAVIAQLLSINDNLKSAGDQSRGLLKNVNANIVVLRAVLQANREAQNTKNTDTS